jgi:hypothetical protein
MLKTRRTPRTATSELVIPSPEPEETPSRPKRVKAGAVVLEREWCHDLLADGTLHIGHLGLLTYLMSVFANGSPPIPAGTVAALGSRYEDGVIIITGNLAYDPLTMFVSWARLLADLEALGFFSVDRRAGGEIRVRQGARLIDAGRRYR